MFSWRARDLVFGHEAALDEDAPQFAAGTLLVGQCLLELLLAQEFLLHQHFAEADFFWPCHAFPYRCFLRGRFYARKHQN